MDEEKGLHLHVCIYINISMDRTINEARKLENFLFRQKIRVLFKVFMRNVLISRKFITLIFSNIKMNFH
jgi:hypothetical protein